MKATGIVRRIDDLGRVVIPKEIRRTLRIKEGDPLEIYTDREGEVIFKKYSPIGELNEFASQYAETLWRTCELPVAICDRDSIIACAGVPRRDFVDKRVTPEAEKLIEERTLYTRKQNDNVALVEGADNWTIACLMPIIAEGDMTGCVISLTDSDRSVRDTEIKLVQTAATFLSKQLES